MFPEYDALQVYQATAETVDGKFRREYLEGKQQEEAPKRGAKEYRAEKSGPSLRDLSFLKVARFVRFG